MSRRAPVELYSGHLQQVTQRWSQSMEAEGFEAVVVHAGSALISFLDDYHYPFRPNPHFLQWLPLTHHHDSVLVVGLGEKPRLIYFQPDDYWHLPPTDPEPWWAAHFDIEIVRRPDAWRAMVPTGRVAWIGDSPGLAEVAGDGLNPDRLLNRLHLHRTRKTEYEIACIQSAVDTAARAHVAAEQAFRDGQTEFGIHMAYLAAAGLEDPELPYNNIVALNEHGAVLHYQDRDRELPESHRSFLIDAGATCLAYCSDITRTYARQPGEFEEMIAAMDALELRLCAGMTAGTDYRDMHLQAHREIAGVLSDFGIIHVSADSAVEQGLSSVFFPHGLGHFLGLQTHDVAGLIANEDGTPIPRPDGHPFLRLTRVLEEGNVLTVEPGLYFIPTLLKQWRENADAAAINWSKVEALLPMGGIRVEDDVVVTNGEPRNLSREAFAAL
ncbi:MAG: Xaa-Pro dipeptidase [Xanthomonadales bacterium]|nr:Xaa-Pro dipeptidase [Xanthomonadales bacterium]